MLIHLKIWWFQLRYGLESGADVSRGLGGAVGGAKIRGAEWTYAKPENGIFGRTVGEARLNALRFWVAKHAQPIEVCILGPTHYGIGQEPASGHKPVIIVEVENGCDTKCDDSLKPYEGLTKDIMLPHRGARLPG